MVRVGKKEQKAAATNGESKPDMEEKNRLKKLAFSKQILSEKTSTSRSTALSPSKTVIKHHGKDILRKSQRKNRFLFSFPGLLAPVSGGKIGDLKDLGTKNPILYLDFPQGQMKLFGTIVYPKNRYLTLQFSRGGKNVVCEDYFDNMIVFSDAWWIGRKDENPKESRLEFPKELIAQDKLECDFKGGAGAQKQSITECGVKHAEQLSPEHEEEENFTESQNSKDVIELTPSCRSARADSKDVIELTPSRRSARAAAKKINFAEASSGDDLVDYGSEASDEEEKIDLDHSTKKLQGQVAVKSRVAAESPSKSKESSHKKQSSLVQASISAMFKKVNKVASLDSVYKRKTAKLTSSKGTPNTGEGSNESDHAGISQGDEDDIEEISSSSKDTEASDEASDEDWAA